MGKLYKRLDKHPGIWRVDGIGPIENHGQLGARAEVYLSGLEEDGLHEPYKEKSLNHQTLKFPIHSASLKDFRIGSIWKDGKRIHDHGTSLERYSVDVSRTQIVPLNYGVKVGEHFWVDTSVPENYFTMAGDNRRDLSPTLYALVPVLNDNRTQWLVVPVSELVCFYAGISSRLLSSVLRGRLDHYVNWNKCRLSGDCVTLYAKRPLSRKEAFVLARIVASPHAKEAFLGIHKHLALTQANNASLPEIAKRPLLLKMSFPFIDETTLDVLGKKIAFIKPHAESVWAFLVMEIRSCSHPFGFSKIVQKSDESVSSGQSGNSDNVPPRFNPLWENEDVEDDLELEDLSADLRLGRLVIRNYTNQFPGFENIVFENDSSFICQPDNGKRGNIGITVNALTVEDGCSSVDAKGNLGVDTQTDTLTQVDRDLMLFLDVLQHMRVTTKGKRWKITTRRLDDNGLVQKGEFIALFPEKIARCRSWHKIQLENGDVRPRQVIWAECELGITQRYFYLLEMELKSGEGGQCTILLHMNDFSKLEDKLFKTLLFLTGIKNRWPSSHLSWDTDKQEHAANILFSNITMHRINHPRRKSESMQIHPEQWNLALLEKIEELHLLDSMLLN